MEAETQEAAGPMARDIISTLLGLSQEAFLAEKDSPVSEMQCLTVDRAVDRYLGGEPLPYVLGEWTFYGLDLYVTPDVLIPRDDTCAVAELAIHRGLFLDKDPRILDLCCGSGCIGLALASRPAGCPGDAGGPFGACSGCGPEEHPAQSHGRPGQLRSAGCHGSAAGISGKI